MDKTGSGSTPKSGTISHRYESGSGSGSFYHQAKIVRATLKPTVLQLLWLFIFEKLCKCSSKKKWAENFFFKLVFCWRLEGQLRIAGCGPISVRHGPAVPDGHQNVTDPEHWYQDVNKRQITTLAGAEAGAEAALPPSRLATRLSSLRMRFFRSSVTFFSCLFSISRALNNNTN